MNYTCGNAFYFANLNAIGGAESFFYYMARKYANKYDMIVFYRNGDEKQVERLKKYTRCIRLEKKDHVTCDKIFVNYVRDILEQCDAKERIFVIHADYKDMIKRGQFSTARLPIDSRIDKYVGVSQLVCDSWKELTGIEAENLYEPVVLDKGQKMLTFISATRLTKEKGWDRMVKLARYLDANDVKYTWFVYTKQNGMHKLPSKNMIFCEPTLDVTELMPNFDAYIQLSDNEGFCLSIAEALIMGVPVICTDLPVLRELGLDDSNSIRLNMDMTDIPLERIKKINELEFTYSPPEDKWDDILSHQENIYDRNKLYRVRATEAYANRKLIDSQLRCIPKAGTEFRVDYYRLIFLLGENRYKDVFVELIDDDMKTL